MRRVENVEAVDFKKVAIITGADGGMGRIHTRTLATEGYHVVMACYDAKLAEPVKEEILSLTGGEIEIIQVDLGNLSSVVTFCNAVKEKFTFIDVLLNNAGVLANQSRTSANNLEYTMAVNYLGHFTLTNLLLPIMGKGTRIVNMISLAYAIGRINSNVFEPKTQKKYNRFIAYGSSKLALYYFMLDASDMWKEKGICFNAADPDIVSTNIIRLDNVVIDKLCDWIFRPLINTPEEGAKSMLAAVLNPEYQNVTGSIFNKGKIAKHKKRFFNNNKDRALLRDMTLKILKNNDIEL